MDDERVWDFERSLWTGDAQHYRELIDAESLMVIPTPPFVLQGDAAVDAVSDTPRWNSVDINDGRIVRPQEGMIVIAYRAFARKENGESYEAYCTSTYRRLSHEEWRVVQHHQSQVTALAGA
jgi:hypothetical protein